MLKMFDLQNNCFSIAMMVQLWLVVVTLHPNTTIFLGNLSCAAIFEGIINARFILPLNFRVPPRTHDGGCVKRATGGNWSSRCLYIRKLLGRWILICESPRPQSLECLLLLLWLSMIVAAIFLWYMVCCEWVWVITIAFNVVCLSHGYIPFNGVFLPMAYYEDDYFLKCTVWLIIIIILV